MTIRNLDAGRFLAGLRAFLRYSHPASFLARCGRNCAGRADCATAGTECMNWRNENRIARISAKDVVIACLGDAESILIFGPGEAKGELKKRLEKNKLSGRIVVVETVDKMTDHQIAAKVRKHFLSESD